MKRYLLMALFVVIGLVALHCEEVVPHTASSDGDADGDSDTGTVDTENMPPGCGDGKLTPDEACDDGNNQNGDGCQGDCLAVEDGYSCNPPGAACHQIAVCGDGVLFLPELCDDGNVLDGDGCSHSCKVEIGWACPEGAACYQTTCGDNIQEGAESCDDGNTMPFDGCSPACQQEPDCSAGAACTSECGDGLVLDEECDDGNQISGDGCSAECKVEPGYECYSEGCEDLENCTLTVSAIYRDFTSSHSDFGIGCDGLAEGTVETTLDANWKPVATGVASGNCTTNFGDWYTAPSAKVGDIVLYPDGSLDSFVNMFHDDGSPWIAYCEGEQATWMAATVAECAAQGCVPCPWDPVTGCSPPSCEFSGSPLFFPIDDVGSELAPAKVPEQYGYPGWPWEEAVLGTATQHNFYFTTEVTYWFRYDETKTATLTFLGDDDVWVFVNGQLAVDLGGVHVPLEASVAIGGATGQSYGMEHNKVYRINVFHAERKMEGSSFKLTLGGFNTARSECDPECGDGVVALGEQCDDGVNDGGYGECAANCMLGEYCGDGIIQDAFEDCDDGNFNNDDDCPSSCRLLVIL